MTSDDGLEPIREHMDEVKALAESELPAASFARDILDHMGVSETNEPEEVIEPKSPSNSEPEQLGVLDY